MRVTVRGRRLLAGALYALFVASSLLSVPVYALLRLSGRWRWLRAVRSSYNLFSPWYDRLATLLPGYMGLVERVVGEARGSQVVLDVGCGTGLAALRLASGGVEVVGVDLSGGQLRVLRGKARGLPVYLVECDAAALPLRGGAFDCVVSTGALSETGAPAVVLAEAVRALRLCGALVFGVYGRGGEALLDPWVFSGGELEEIARKAGLRGVTVTAAWPYYLVLRGRKPGARCGG